MLFWFMLFLLILGIAYLVLFYISKMRKNRAEVKTNNSDISYETADKYELVQNRAVITGGKHKPLLRTCEQSPLVIAHRGGAGLKPENTMPAFINAVNLGVDMLEIDVRLTADGNLVTHHDSTIDRMSDGQGEIYQKTYQELKEFDFSGSFSDTCLQSGEEKVEITLLQDVMQKFENMQLTVEIKDGDERGRKAVDELMKLVKKFAYEDKLIVGSFHDEVLKYLKNNYSEDIKISASKKKVAGFYLTNKLNLDGLWNFDIAALQIPTTYKGFKLAQSDLIKAAHRKNIAVHFWTVNDPAEMKRLIDLNADGIMTDRPDVLLDIIK